MPKEHDQTSAEQLLSRSLIDFKSQSFNSEPKRALDCKATNMLQSQVLTWIWPRGESHPRAQEEKRKTKRTEMWADRSCSLWLYSNWNKACFNKSQNVFKIKQGVKLNLKLLCASSSVLWVLETPQSVCSLPKGWGSSWIWHFEKTNLVQNILEQASP